MHTDLMNIRKDEEIFNANIILTKLFVKHVKCTFVAEEDNTSSNYGVDLADEDTKAGDDRAKSPYGLHSLPLS